MATSTDYIGPVALIASMIILATVPAEANNLFPLMFYNTMLCTRHTLFPNSDMVHSYILLCGASLVAAVSVIHTNPSVLVAITLSAFATIEFRDISK